MLKKYCSEIYIYKISIKDQLLNSDLPIPQIITRPSRDEDLTLKLTSRFKYYYKQEFHTIVIKFKIR